MRRRSTRRNRQRRLSGRSSHSQGAAAVASGGALRMAAATAGHENGHLNILTSERPDVDLNVRTSGRRMLENLSSHFVLCKLT